MAAKLLGYTQGSDIIGRPLAAFFHPDEQDEPRSRFQSPDPRFLSTGPLRRRLIRTDGSILHVEVRAAAVTYDGQAASEIVARDLTARLQIEEAFAASEARYRGLLDAMTEGVVLQDRALTIQLWNPAAERILGLTGDQLAGRTSFDPMWRIIDESGATLTADQHPVAEALRTGTVVTRVMGIERPDGERVWVLATSVPLINAGVTEAHAVETTFADITQTRLSAERVADSERRYRMLAEHSIDLITRRSVDHVLEYVSPSHETVLGWRPEEMVGRDARDFIHPEHQGHLPRLLARTGVAQTLSRVRHKAGHYVWLEAKSTQLFDGEGRVVGYQVSARDITERRALEEQLRHAQKMDALGRMASGVAHDFNNLLTVIQSSSELLQLRTAADTESTAILHDISLATERAASLTAQLLTFARRQHSVPERLHVPAVLRRAYPLLSRLAGTQVSVELTCSDAASVALVEGEAAQLEQVIYNLIVNARDAMPRGGTIRVECDVATVSEAMAHHHGVVMPGEYVTLVVRDEGVGMTEETLTKLFDPFFTTKAQGKGTGLGLATLLGIVQQAQGSVRVASAVGEGSTFTIFWPQVAGAPTTSPAPREETPSTFPAPVRDETTDTVRREPGTASMARVLVVDDEDGVRKIVTAVLRRAGFDVIDVPGGAAALAVLRSPGHGVQSVVTDVRMPGMSGIEFVDTLHREQIDLPVLFMSGQLDVALPAEWPSTLPHMFVAKPFSMSELVLRVQQLVAAAKVA